MKFLAIVFSLLFVCTLNAAVLKDHKTVGHPMGVSESWYKITYDFAKDGGAIAAYDVITVQDDLAITDFYAFVETAITGTPAFDLGVTGSGTAFWNAKAHGDLTIGTVHGMDTAKPVKIAKDAKIISEIKTGTATAGKMHFHFKVKNVK